MHLDIIYHGIWPTIKLIFFLLMVNICLAIHCV